MADGGGTTFDEGLVRNGDAFPGRRPRQVRLESGDAASDA
jgi:hypothetical protein